MNTLAGRRALVSGGGSGVGAAIALALVEAGAQVCISGRRAEPLEALAAAHPGLTWAVGDVTDEASVAAMFAAAGPVEIVIANAGGATSELLRRTSLAVWSDTLAVNLTGVFLTFREALRQLPPGWGRLVAIASILGLKGDPYVTAYGAAKHGVVGMVRGLAKEVARDGVTVNALCPGYVDTPMTDRTVANIAARTGLDEAATVGRITASNPIGRLIAPVEVASAAVWLCTDGAAMVNGQAIAIAGGEI